MSHVGLAASVGVVVEIPLVVRSLADGLGTFSDTGRRIPIDIGLLQTIAAGTDIDEFGRVVDSYVFRWWEATIIPDNNAVLGHGTIEQCLKHHRKASKKRGAQHVPALVIQPIPAVQIGPRPPARHTTGHTSPGPTSCSSCEPNRALATALVAKVQTMKDLSSALIASKKANMEDNAHQATASFVLHQQALQKEADTAPPVELPMMSGDTDTARTSRQIRQLARTELNRLLVSPPEPAHYKWTMGETLTKEEVLSLAHGDRVVGHSGYNASLTDGPWAGEWSATHSDPGSADADAPVSPHVNTSPPPTQNTVPPFFLHQVDWNSILRPDDFSNAAIEEDIGSKAASEDGHRFNRQELAAATAAGVIAETVPAIETRWFHMFGHSSATGNDVPMDEDHNVTARNTPPTGGEQMSLATATIHTNDMIVDGDTGVAVVPPGAADMSAAPSSTDRRRNDEVGQRSVETRKGKERATAPVARQWFRLAVPDVAIPGSVVTFGEGPPTGATAISTVSATETAPTRDIGTRWAETFSHHITPGLPAGNIDSSGPSKLPAPYNARPMVLIAPALSSQENPPALPVRWRETFRPNASSMATTAPAITGNPTGTPTDTGPATAADVGQSWLQTYGRTASAGVPPAETVPAPADNLNTSWLSTFGHPARTGVPHVDSLLRPTGPPAPHEAQASGSAQANLGIRWREAYGQPKTTALSTASTAPAVTTPTDTGPATAADVGRSWLQTYGRTASAGVPPVETVPTPTENLGSNESPGENGPVRTGLGDRWRQTFGTGTSTSTSVALSAGLRHRAPVAEDSDSSAEASDDGADEINNAMDNEAVTGTGANSDTGTSGASSDGTASTNTTSSGSDSEETGDEEDAISEHHQPTGAVEGTGAGQIVPNHSISQSRPFVPADFDFLPDAYFEDPLYESDFDSREVLEESLEGIE